MAEDKAQGPEADDGSKLPPDEVLENAEQLEQRIEWFKGYGYELIYRWGNKTVSMRRPDGHVVVLRVEKLKGEGKKGGKTALVVFGVLTTFIILGVALGDEGEGDKPTPGTGFVYLSHWENDASEDVTICAIASGPSWDSETICWLAEGRDKAGWTWEEGIPCKPDMQEFFVSIHNVRGNVLDSAIYEENMCHGNSVKHEVHVTSSLLVDVRRV